jgi:NADPH-dependent 7-cyano-7-deazaguanine reductase QueF
MGEVRSHSSNISQKGACTRHGQRKTEGSNRGVKLIWPQLTCLCPQTGISPVQNIQIRFLSIN